MRHFVLIWLCRYSQSMEIQHRKPKEPFCTAIEVITQPEILDSFQRGYQKVPSTQTLKRGLSVIPSR